MSYDIVVLTNMFDGIEYEIRASPTECVIPWGENKEVFLIIDPYLSSGNTKTFRGKAEDGTYIKLIFCPPTGLMGMKNIPNYIASIYVGKRKNDLVPLHSNLMCFNNIY